MTAAIKDRPLFENEDWLVGPAGLEHKGTGYFIEREALGSRRADGLWSWPLHMAEKSWCRMAPFMEAFSCAAAVHGVEADVALARSFSVARQEIAPWPAVRSAFEGPPSLQLEGGAPILVEQAATPRYSQPAKRPPTGETRGRFARAALPRPAGLSWPAPRPLRRAGTRIVQLLQAAWNIR
ncbi:MAG TPA: hypothetical protein VIL09_07710 [Microvirga sp.]|jgi:hypothetical protein